MTRLLKTVAEATRIATAFETAGAVRVETDILQPAETLLDLYGEDIRARAYTTQDPLKGEQMLRPDFTVPVVQMHMDVGAEPARYTYSGKVFRRQEDDPNRSSETMQVGYEVFDRDNPIAADAEVFTVIRDALGDIKLNAMTGDIGILTAAVQGLDTSDARKNALMRHIWRPTRFRRLLDRFSGAIPMSASRKAHLELKLPLELDVPQIGLRSQSEVEARLLNLKAEADVPPLSENQVALIEGLLKLRETLPNVLSKLHDIAVDLPSIANAVDVFAARIDALADRGHDVENLMFDGAYGLTQMEYYDGFVFGFTAEALIEQPVATGGRYDALTRVLGRGASIPAVGGVIRPELLLSVKEGAQ